MTLQQISYVLSIAKSGSMNKAAEELFVSQPSLTSAVRELEEEIGITDFVPEPLGRYVFESKVEKELINVFRTTYDGDIRPNAQELDTGRFWSRNEIIENIGKGVFTPNFENEYRKFFI